VPGPTPDDLRKKYEQVSSKDLLRALRSKGQYTDRTLDVIRSLLRERELNPEEWNLRALDSRRGYSRSEANEPYLVHAHCEITAGRLWRAKEILSGNLPVRGYDLTLYEAYGALLAQMGDTLEAGRFLFLSGAQGATYREPVQLYLRRFGGKDWKHLTGTFPAAAKLPSIADYPESVSAILTNLGATETVSVPDALSVQKRAGSSAAEFGCMLVLMFCIVSLVVGAGTILVFLFAWVFG
jgi:hypothetical protein